MNRRNSKNVQGDIRVSSTRKSFLHLFQKNRDKEDKGSIAYTNDSLDGRNPVDFGEAQRLKDEQEAEQKKATYSAPSSTTKGVNNASAASTPKKSTPSPSSNKSGTAPPPSSSHPRASAPPANSSSKPRKPTFPNRKPYNPLAGRNPVDFDKSNGYDKNGIKIQKRASTPAAFAGSGLDGRNPVDFDKCDPYGNPIHRPHIGDEQDIDGIPCDPYGNPIRDRESRTMGVPSRTDSLTGRNPVDFDKASCLTTVPAAATKNKNNDRSRRGSELDGRNPVDFDKAVCSPTTMSVANKNAVREGNDDSGADTAATAHNDSNNTCCIHCPHCRAARVAEAAEQCPVVVKREQEPPIAIAVSASPVREPHKPDPPTEDPPIPQSIATTKDESPTSPLRKLKLGKGAIPQDTTKDPYQIHGKVVHLDSSKNSQDEDIYLNHAETIKREIKKQEPAWAKMKLKQTKRGSEIKEELPKRDSDMIKNQSKPKRKPAPSTREPFSLKTYHQPRTSIT